ncbi:hypothetical protein FL865_07510 [Listeria monocytogenes]|nr:hypothetical protein [Listeria monocytogenes]
MVKSKVKGLIIGTVSTFLLGIFSPSLATVVQAAENTSDTEQVESVILQESVTSAEFVNEEKVSEQALEAIEDKYEELAEENTKAIENGEEIILTAEDEARMSQAVNDYLKMVKYNPRLRGVGKHWWNSRSFVGGVLDAAFIAIGFGAGVKSAATLMKVVRSNRQTITRTIEKQIKLALGLSIGATISKALDMISAITGVTLGYAIAWGIDYVDGRRLDGYIFA